MNHLTRVATRGLTALVLSVCLLPAAHAGLLEDLLAVPAIQQLLGRQPDLQATVKRCADAKFRQGNATACQQADQADRLLRMPPELRAVLASPSAAASLRELCLAAQTSPQKNSYLCAELVKADQSFFTAAEQQRKAAAEAEAQRRAAETINDRQIN